MCSSGQNIGLFAFPLVEALWGEEAVFVMIMWDIGNGMFIWTLTYFVAWYYRTKQTGDALPEPVASPPPLLTPPPLPAPPVVTRVADIGEGAPLLTNRRPRVDESAAPQVTGGMELTPVASVDAAVAHVPYQVLGDGTLTVVPNGPMASQVSPPSLQPPPQVSQQPVQSTQGAPANALPPPSSSPLSQLSSTSTSVSLPPSAEPSPTKQKENIIVQIVRICLTKSPLPMISYFLAIFLNMGGMNEWGDPIQSILSSLASANGPMVLVLLGSARSNACVMALHFPLLRPFRLYLEFVPSFTRSDRRILMAQLLLRYIPGLLFGFFLLGIMHWSGSSNMHATVLAASCIMPVPVCDQRVIVRDGLQRWSR